MKDFAWESGFAATECLPQPGSWLDLLLDPANVRAFHSRGSNLFHRSAIAAPLRRRLASAHPRAVALHALLTLGGLFSHRDARALLPADLERELLEVGVLERLADGIRSQVLAFPYRGRFYVCDPPRFQEHPEYVYSGRSSFSAVEDLASWRHQETPVLPPRLLDLGCGAGFNAIEAAARGTGVAVATDIVERCLRFARLNAELNDVAAIETRYSDVFSHVDGQFDAIVSNTPCVWEELQHATFATGGKEFGTTLPARIISESIDHLVPRGQLVAVVSAPIVGGRPYIAEAISRACGDREVAVQIAPLFREYEFRHAGIYRRHAISAFVRYVVRIRTGSGRSLVCAPESGLRARCYAARAASVRLVAGVAARSPRRRLPR